MITPETLRRDVEALATAAGRMVGTEGHRRARAYLSERLRELDVPGYAGDSVELPYAAAGVTFTNIIARVKGTDSGGARY